MLLAAGGVPHHRSLAGTDLSGAGVASAAPGVPPGGNSPAARAGLGPGSRSPREALPEAGRAQGQRGEGVLGTPKSEEA